MTSKGTIPVGERSMSSKHLVLSLKSTYSNSRPSRSYLVMVMVMLMAMVVVMVVIVIMMVVVLVAYCYSRPSQSYLRACVCLRV
jgi:heme/copper-type cytochrome/quinol oxidase subunit 2